MSKMVVVRALATCAQSESLILFVPVSYDALTKTL